MAYAYMITFIFFSTILFKLQFFRIYNLKLYHKNILITEKIYNYKYILSDIIFG